MKLYKLLLLTLLISATTSKVNCQISIVSNDMPTAGNIFRTSIALNAIEFDFAQTGANFEWDFSSLIPVNQRVDTFKTLQQTPVFFWPTFFTSANLAVSFDPGNLLPGLTFDGAYQFLSKTTAAYRDFGYGLIIAGLPLPLKFSNPDVIYSFPMNMGNTFASNADLEFSLPDIGYLSIDRQRENLVDGWGTLKTPYGTFEVLRLKSTVFEIDSVYIDSISQGIRIERNYIEYKWIGKNKGIPLLQATFDEFLSTVAIYQDSIRDLTVGIPEVNDFNRPQVFPNPFREELFFKICANNTEQTLVSLLNIQGLKVIEDQLFNTSLGCDTYRLKLPESLLKHGTYILKIELGNKIHHVKVIAGHR
ncbi:MAG: T9SS type A sorting domain-containing protein [Bacteroidales bacterium]|nr:T9SS type A sorting domain-containing protein [Bacteroidales bacterium]